MAHKGGSPTPLHLFCLRNASQHLYGILCNLIKNICTKCQSKPSYPVHLTKEPELLLAMQFVGSFLLCTSILHNNKVQPIAYHTIDISFSIDNDKVQSQR